LTVEQTDSLERMQHRTVNIILTGMETDEGMNILKLQTLKHGHKDLCRKLNTQFLKHNYKHYTTGSTGQAGLL